jgi:hypothetical protein
MPGLRQGKQAPPKALVSSLPGFRLGSLGALRRGGCAVTARLPDCASCGKRISAKTLRDQGPGFECDGVDWKICDGCWSSGENNEAWDSRIKNRIRLRARRAS